MQNFVSGQFEAISDNAAMSFVMSLQSIKKAQQAWAGIAISDRVVLIEKFLETLRANKEHLASLLSEKEGMARDEMMALQIEAGLSLIEQNLKQAESAATPENLGSPSGLFLALPPAVFSFRWLCEKVSAAWLAGNAVVIRAPDFSVTAFQFVKIWNQALSEALNQKALLTVVHAPMVAISSLDETLTAHPAIRAVMAAGLSTSQMESVVKNSVATFKKLHLAGLGNNSALLLADADMNLAAEEIVRGLTAAGGTAWAINKVFVLESQMKDFEAILKEKIKSAKAIVTSHADNDRLQALYAEAKSSNGKHFSGNYPEPLVISDLSHCSTLQQDALQAPILFLLPVKYQHEMLKWANTGYLGLCNFVFGSREKVQKVAARLESGVVISNRWLHTDFSAQQAETWPVGVKQSFYGISDSHIFGDFFSERRIIDAGS